MRSHEVRVHAYTVQGRAREGHGRAYQDSEASHDLDWVGCRSGKVIQVAHDVLALVGVDDAVGEAHADGVLQVDDGLVALAHARVRRVWMEMPKDAEVRMQSVFWTWREECLIHTIVKNNKNWTDSPHGDLNKIRA